MKKDIIWAATFILAGLTIIAYDPAWLHHPVVVGLLAVGSAFAWGLVAYDLYTSKKEHVSTHVDTQIGNPSDEAGVSKDQW